MLILSVMQVLREDTTGALDMDFLHSDFTNAYLNVTNIVLKIVPVDASSNQTVLVNAHFDSTLGSPGKAVLWSYIMQLCVQLVCSTQL